MNTVEENKKNLFLLLVIGILILEAGFYYKANVEINNQIKIEAENKVAIEKSLENIPVEAKAVSAYNISKGEKIFGINDSLPLPLASLAKTMTVVVSLNNHELGDVVYIPLSALAEKGDYGMFGNEKWYLSDLAKSTLVASVNDGASALTAGNSQFIQNMNDKAKRLGMRNTSFLNPTGLDIDTTNAGGFISAEDANALASYAFRAYPQIFSATTLSELKVVSLSGFTHDFKNTNTIVDKIPNLLFSKTGFTDIAGGNLTVIFKNSRGEEIAVTVLGSTYNGRFTDMQKLVDTLYDL